MFLTMLLLKFGEEMLVRRCAESSIAALRLKRVLVVTSYFKGVFPAFSYGAWR